MSKYFNTIAVNFNVMPLQIALRRQPGLFGKYKERCLGESPHRESDDIWVRYNNYENVIKVDAPLNSEHPANAPHRSVWYPVYYQLPQLRPLIFDLMTLVEGEDLGTVLLVKLEPGKQVYPHSDLGWSAGYYEKYFIPIQTSAKATFNFPDGVIAPELGHVYWFDNSILHSYTNNTPDDVIMLIVTIRSDKVQGAL
jgi:hypothetical protein